MLLVGAGTASAAERAPVDLHPRPPTLHTSSDKTLDVFCLDDLINADFPRLMRISTARAGH